MEDKGKRLRVSPKILGALEVLAEASLGTSDFIMAFLNAGYGASQAKLDWEFDKIQRKREKESLSRKKRQSLYTLLSNLKKDNLIEKKINKKWGITQKGIQRLTQLKERVLPVREFVKAEDKEFKIVIFDVPEILRFKRRWLRQNLINLGFTMLQKSVWAGKVKLPEEFIIDLQKANLNLYVEIFSINRKGTLKNLLQ